ncbi:oxidoreductase [Aliarcobacter cryaerophilus]|uniref:Oxidoreductase n=2 Tax=unclassified Arcobacter TaxID=2593671 RepID=A0AA96CQQ8_9BACT|nr:oxidoreductase [Arcobacter sp. AZ-2023]WPD09110.1 oxidoreductase [Arcobacter sp. DSM 115954]WNL13941.1 oxidoreductase [Arcobacter sp. AZ-2023]WNL20178.1 oxidoreductase [Arcobacter sp. AZ-2023]WNL22320.1 oxidoreductase [Arcobacter sp. AZ-2023]
MLKDKIVVITGGAGKIGSTFAKAVLENRGIVIIADVNEEFSNKIIERIINNLSLNNLSPDSRILYHHLNISSKSSIEKLLNFLDKEFGKIDALVNNAYPKSKNYGKKFFEIDIDDFNEFLNLHLGGYFNVSQQFIKYFLEKKIEGNIVNISSIQGIIAPAFETYEGTNMHSPVEYTAVKHGLLGMTKYMAKMFKKDGIRVNAISPGGILDNQPEQFLNQYKKRCGTKGMLNSEDLSSSLVYLLSDNSKYINGQNIVVDDGFTL